MRLKVLFALAYGHNGPDGQGGYVPGLSNEVMALVVRSQKDRYYHLSVQQEIGTAMRILGVEPDFEVLYGGRKYMTTEQVIDAMLEDLRQEGVDPKDCDIHVLCHSIHWSGCKWILQARGITPRKAVFVPTTDDRGKVWRKIPYDPDSHQFQGRNAFNAWLYKIWAGVTKLIKGEISIFGPNVKGVVMPTGQSPARIKTPVWKKVIGTFAAGIIIAAVGIGTYMLVSASRVQPPPVGQLFQVMMHQENAKFQVRQANGTLADQDRQVVTVVFVGKDHGIRPPQYVPRELVFKDESIPMGHGKWVFVKYPAVEGIDYLGRVEFRYNGELGAQRQPYPDGTPRQ